MSRRIGQHRETMCQQPLKKKHHTAVCRKIAKGKAHRVRIERCRVPGLRCRHAQGIGRSRKIGKERGLVLSFAVKVGPIQQQTVTGVADTGIARPDIRIDAGGEEFALMTSGVEADRIARIVAKPEIVERRRPAIDRQTQFSVSQNQIGQHGQSPSIWATVAITLSPDKPVMAAGLVSQTRAMYRPAIAVSGHPGHGKAH